jgi:hypothetical protein
MQNRVTKKSGSDLQGLLHKGNGLVLSLKSALYSSRSNIRKIPKSLQVKGKM